MSRPGPFATISVQDRDLDAVQRNVEAVFAQLEDIRRGVLAGTVTAKTVSTQLGEGLFVEYSGEPNATLDLPSAAVRGPGRFMVLFVANGSTGNLTLRAAGTQKVAGGSTLVLATGVMACLVGNGGTKWYRAT